MRGHPRVTKDSLVRPSRAPSRRTRAVVGAWSIAGLVDQMLDTYVEWREHAALVADAYVCWCDASASEGTSRFAAYLVALDQEQAAACKHQEAVSRLHARL